VAADDHADLYELEQSEAGPAGTVIAFNRGTFIGNRTHQAARRSLHDASELPARTGRMGPTAGLGRQQPCTRLVPVRAPGDATAARALGIPAAQTSLLESTDNPGDETALPRTRSHTLACNRGVDIPMRASRAHRVPGQYAVVSGVADHAVQNALGFSWPTRNRVPGPLCRKLRIRCGSFACSSVRPRSEDAAEEMYFCQVQE
jgi:hypothetical protein